MIDTAAPSSTAAFPVASGNYTVAEWNAGCATSGLCGTYYDGSGSGVVDVEVSIRQGAGDYWDGAGFTSASEVWNNATLAAGDWEYGFDAANFPADGSYTVRVRARDDAGNTEAASSRTFDFDATEPETSIDSSQPDPSNSPNASFDFSSTSPARPSSAASTAAPGRTARAPRAISASPTAATASTCAPPTPRATRTATRPRSSGTSTRPTPRAPQASRPPAAATRPPSGTPAAPRAASAAPTTTAPAPASSTSRSPSARAAATTGTAATSRAPPRSGTTRPSRRRLGARLRRRFGFPADGNYTVRVRATDDAGNTQSPSTRTFAYDSTLPSSTTSFPADSGRYNASGWDAGCDDPGLCGTYGDGPGTGVAEVEVSIRQGTGNYWNGTGFSSATEVWNNATIAARRLGARARFLRLPRRRQLHRARPRDRHRRQRRGADRAGRTRTTRWHRRRRSTPSPTTRPLDRPELRLLLERARLHLRVPPRRRLVEPVHQPEGLHQPGRRQPHLRGARHRPAPATRTPPRRPSRGSSTRSLRARRRLPRRLRQLHRGRVERRLRHQRPVRHLRRRLRLRRGRGRDLHPPGHGQLLERHRLLERDRGLERRHDRRRRLGAMRSTRPTSPPTAPTRCACAHTRRRQRGDGILAHLRLRRDRARDDDRLVAGRPDELAERHLRLLVERARLDLRVQHRQRRLDGLHEPRELPRPLRRQPQLRRARHRPSRQHRRQPGHGLLERRHDGAPSSAATFPTAGEQLHDRRVERRLPHRRPLRHLRRRLRLRRLRGRDLHPPGHGRLLGRQRLHERHRGLERRDHRRRRLGAGLRRRRLPRRRQLHRARPRDRRGGQHEVASTRTFTYDATAPARPPSSPPPPSATTPPAGTRAATTPVSAAPTGDGPVPASPRSRSPSARAPATTGTAPASRAPPRSGTTQPSPPATGSYALDSSDLPADGNYTVRVRATDVAGKRRGAVEPDLHVRHHGPADDDRLLAVEPGR